jgi:hypothetical protein
MMRREVNLSFGPAGRLLVVLPVDDTPWDLEHARRWLDERFIAMECEPLRASGKLLTADKVLAVAQALGPQRLNEDEALRLDFARAITAALNRPIVGVDVAGLAVSF